MNKHVENELLPALPCLLGPGSERGTYAAHRWLPTATWDIVVLLWALGPPWPRPPAAEPRPLTWTDVQVVMTLVPRLVLSLRSSGKEGVFPARGACVARNEGFFGDMFTSVPLPKAWMAFPVGGQAGAERSGPPPPLLPGTVPAATFPVAARSWDSVQLVRTSLC